MTIFKTPNKQWLLDSLFLMDTIFSERGWGQRGKSPPTGLERWSMSLGLVPAAVHRLGDVLEGAGRADSTQECYPGAKSSLQGLSYLGEKSWVYTNNPRAGPTTKC